MTVTLRYRISGDPLITVFGKILDLLARFLLGPTPPYPTPTSPTLLHLSIFQNFNLLRKWRMLFASKCALFKYIAIVI